MKHHDPHCDLVQRSLEALATNAELLQLEEALRADEPFALGPAAGILFGILGKSVVFACVAPLASNTIFLLQESFETGPSPAVAGISRETGRWSGDYTKVVYPKSEAEHFYAKAKSLQLDWAGKNVTFNETTTARRNTNPASIP